MARILVADDHAVVRRGLRALLESESGWEVCAEAENGREAVRETRRCRPDVAILDFGMPDLNGIEATRQILEASPATKVLLFTMHDADDVFADALDAGVSGFLVKSDADSELVAAVSSLLAGRRYFSRRFGGPEADPQRRRAAIPKLTPREREVTQLIAEGRSTKEVAAILGVSLKTADTHRTNVMRKLGVHAVADLVRWAVRNRLVQP